MPARKPEELDRFFADALNAGDLESLVALYEPQAALAPEPGSMVVGTTAIREALAAFLALKPRIALTGRLIGQCGDIALVTAPWTLSGTGPDGKPVEMQGNSMEVCHRQENGDWLFAIDTPWGLADAAPSAMPAPGALSA